MNCPAWWMILRIINDPKKSLFLDEIFFGYQTRPRPAPIIPCGRRPSPWTGPCSRAVPSSTAIAASPSKCPIPIGSGFCCASSPSTSTSAMTGWWSTTRTTSSTPPGYVKKTENRKKKREKGKNVVEELTVCAAVSRLWHGSVDKFQLKLLYSLYYPQPKKGVKKL